MKEVSVIVVNWNACAFLRACLVSLTQNASKSLREIIVVDNASMDDSVEMVRSEFPDIVLLESNTNLGFAKANNLAMSRMSGSKVGLVNSDVVVHPGCMDRLAQYLDDHPDVGLVGPRILGGDGSLQRTCRRFPGVWNTLCRVFAVDRVFPNVSFLSGYELPPNQHGERREVEVLSGCFLMAKVEALDGVGMLDERFFFYAEDIDWCKRFRDAKWKVVYLPECVATHIGGVSTSQAPIKYSIQMLRATLDYWKKHHGDAGGALYKFLMVCNHGLRLLGRCLLLGIGPIGNRHKIMEDIECLRWLVTGKELSKAGE